MTGKVLRRLSRLRGGGSALPGLVVEKLDSRFLARTLGQLPYGVAVVSGTNGKTTTTKMIVTLLESQGLKVFTNPTGSNFKRGIISALIEKSDYRGKIDADIAVLELDEAHGALFVRDIKPRYSLILNVMRDQLDRFGEIDTTRRMLEEIALATTHGVVLNREDKLVCAIADKLDKKIVRFFGLSPKVRSHFPSDDELYAGSPAQPGFQAAKSDVILDNFKEDSATFTIDGESVATKLKLRGAYNIFNAAAALAFVRVICEGKADQTSLMGSLSGVTPAFGRGETLLLKNASLELVLVKNPSGFRLALSSFEAGGAETMIAINDNYADGRDMSWLWDIDFSSLRKRGVAMVSGTRAYDMALRLQYDDVAADRTVPSLSRALETFLARDTPVQKRIYCTYTAMLGLRKELKKYAKVERAL